MGKAVNLLSSAGGVGKSVLACLMAESSALSGQSVLLIDCGTGRGVHAFLSGESPAVSYDLGDACRGACLLGNAVYRAEAGFYMMPGAANDEGVNPKKISRIVEAAKLSFDLIIIDCPSIGISGAQAFSAQADMNIICTTTSLFHLNSAAWLRRHLPESDDKCRLVLTRLSADLIKDDINQNIDIAIDTVGARLIGVQPEEKAIMAGCGGEGIPKNSLCGKEAKNIIDRIHGRDIPLIKL